MKKTSNTKHIEVINNINGTSRNNRLLFMKQMLKKDINPRTFFYLKIEIIIRAYTHRVSALTLVHSFSSITASVTIWYPFNAEAEARCEHILTVLYISHNWTTCSKRTFWIYDQFSLYLCSFVIIFRTTCIHTQQFYVQKSDISYLLPYITIFQINHRLAVKWRRVL